MSDQEQIDFAIILKALAESGFSQPYKHIHVIVYNDDYTFDSVSLLHQDNKVLFSKEDAQKLLTIMMQDYNEIAMEYGYLKSFNA